MASFVSVYFIVDYRDIFDIFTCDFIILETNFNKTAVCLLKLLRKFRCQLKMYILNFVINFTTTKNAKYNILHYYYKWEKIMINNFEYHFTSVFCIRTSKFTIIIMYILYVFANFFGTNWMSQRSTTGPGKCTLV